MLSVNNIEVVYHNVILAVRGVSLEVGDNRIAALLGANGAGKSTVLKAISSLVKIEVGKVIFGDIHFDGNRLDKLGIEDIVSLGIAHVLEGRRVLEHLTCEENLEVSSRVSGSSIKTDLERVYYYFPQLRELRHSTSGYVSGGEQQMLVMGRALMAHPKLMLLDEPSLGLGPLIVDEIFSILKRINQEEKTAILLVEQNAVAALDLAEYGYVMETGRVVLDGPSDRLKENEDVKEFYLGFGALSRRKSYREVKHYKRRKRWLG